MFHPIAFIARGEEEMRKESNWRNGLEHVPACSTWPPDWLQGAPAKAAEDVEIDPPAESKADLRESEQEHAPALAPTNAALSPSALSLLADVRAESKRVIASFPGRPPPALVRILNDTLAICQRYAEKGETGALARLPGIIRQYAANAREVERRAATAP
jgi:hypothetical protein